MHAKIHSCVRSNHDEALGIWIQPTGAGREPTLEDIVIALKREQWPTIAYGATGMAVTGAVVGSSVVLFLSVKGSSGRRVTGTSNQV
jgi:hypothetical protein